MANRIKGLTIEIGGNTTKLQRSLSGLDRSLNNTQNKLKDIDKLLKLDPRNTELLTQKQRALEDSIKGTKLRLNELKTAQEGVAKGSEDWDTLQREIIATEQQLESLQRDYRSFGSVGAQQVAAVGRSMEELGGKIEGVGRKLAPVSAAGGAVLGALGKLGYEAVQNADDLNTLAKQTGFTTEELQQFRYASDLIDVSAEDITGSISKLRKAMTGHADAWEALGVATTDANGNLRDSSTVFYETLQALSQISNETERDTLAMEIFGKSADQLAGIIDDGGAALKQYGQEAKDLGLILDQDTLDALNQTNDSIDRLKAQGTANLAKLGATVATTFGPYIEKAAALAGKLADRIGNLSPEQAGFIAKAAGVVAAISPVLVVGGKLIGGIGKFLTLAPKVISVVNLLTTTGLGPLGLALGALVAVGVTVYNHWDEITAWWSGTVVPKFEQAGAELRQDWERIKATGAQVRDGVVNAWQTMKDRVAGIIDTVKGKIDGFRQKFADLRASVADAIDNIRSKFNFEWSLPHIKLPHFRVQGGKWPYGLGGEGYLPSIHVDWYKKAYRNPVLFSSPTVMATPNGYKGFGDGSGAEIVMGLDRLRELVGAQQGGSVTINVYPSAGMDEKTLAREIQQIYVDAARDRRLLNA